MPCYNDGVYIQKSINSVLGQTYKNIELIIVNDGSTDKNTLDILETLNDDRINVYHTNRLKPAGARNYGIKQSRGEYILPLDADDIIDFSYVEKAEKVLSGDQRIGAVYCEAELFGKKKGKWKLQEYSLKRMLVDNIVFVTTLFRKEDWQQIGGFDESLQYGMEDYDFWLSILEMGKDIYQIPEVLFYYRIKSDSRTTQFMRDKEKIKETYLKIYKNHPKLYQNYKEEYAVALRNAYIDKVFTIYRIIEVRNKLKWVLKVFELPGLKKYYGNLFAELKNGN